jgi:hypothetical protein
MSTALLIKEMFRRSDSLKTLLDAHIIDCKDGKRYFLAVSSHILILGQ